MPVTIYTILHLSSILLFTVIIPLFYLTDRQIKPWKIYTLLFLILLTGVSLSREFSISLIGTWLSLKLILFIAISVLMISSKSFPHYKQRFFQATIILLLFGICIAVTQPF